MSLVALGKASDGDAFRPTLCDRKTRRETRRKVAKIMGADGERVGENASHMGIGKLQETNVLCQIQCSSRLKFLASAGNCDLF
jgi:hypothetical protein